ncbi:hypothetical protein PHSY_005579 [Pseudozyma hubeiensis SY62]|uniref:Uncharacterized protein n=1 Tax=Pseudozyma hubeiensis (strain SY62) TaxID=1305764 RepID=R9P9E3_PSEHS|nr:hypothetical protein PHSY_005579 [Pseudozyma hubeiensis SY62]GAC97991.1 hypothetical protein PHSY_005579 [Pseudozyma hubeiensis SY62]
MIFAGDLQLRGDERRGCSSVQTRTMKQHKWCPKPVDCQDSDVPATRRCRRFRKTDRCSLDRLITTTVGDLFASLCALHKSLPSRPVSPHRPLY